MQIEDYLSQYYQLDDIEEMIVNIAKETKTPILSISKAKILSFLVKILKPKDCLEVGLGLGFSTYAILKELESNANLISIDKNFHRIDLFYEKIYKKFNKKLRRKLTVYPLDAFYIFEIFEKIDKKFDFIFIDSQKRDYYYFYDYLVNLTQKNSLILIDNITYNFQTFKKITERSEKYIEGIKLVEKFLKKISKSKKFKFTFFTNGDGMCCLIRL